MLHTFRQETRLGINSAFEYEFFLGKVREGGKRAKGRALLFL